MPYHKSCRKRMLTSAKAARSNRSMKTHMKSATRKLLAAKDSESAQAALRTAFSVFDRATKQRVVHRNKAANQKSRLSSIAQKLA